ncbi:unnamed protein product [Symbiodinium sp. CCMP2456]|nr:unnamed protein product [Symbiodinium sp. CCMP2456]
MVEADLELPFSVRTSPMLAELVHRKLNLCAGIAQMAQMKTRVPQRCMQESFADGTASVHVELLIPRSVALSAVLSEQVSVMLTSCVAGIAEREVCDLSRRERRGRRRTMHMLRSTSGVLQFSVGIRPPIARAIPLSAASSCRRGVARVCPSLQCCRCGESLLQGRFTRMQSWHLSFSRPEGPHSLLDLAIADAMPYKSAPKSRIPLARYPASNPSFYTLFTSTGCGRGVLVFPVQIQEKLVARQECTPSLLDLAIADAVARKKDPVLRSAAPPLRMMSMPLSPSPSPSAACVLRLEGAVRSVFQPDIEEAVEANCLVISPLEETLRQAQVPFVLMIRNLLPLLPSQALQGREVLLNLVIVGHSHGGVIGHSLAQCLESAGFRVKGIVAVDTLGLPRRTEMPSPRFDPQALARHLSPYHWQLTAPKVNMMAPEVPPFRRMLPSRAELLVGGAVFPPKYMKVLVRFQHAAFAYAYPNVLVGPAGARNPETLSTGLKVVQAKKWLIY